MYAIKVVNATRTWRLASDVYDSGKPAGYSTHADWFNGWRTEAMETFVNLCDKAAMDCHAHLLGDGREIYQY
jgi:hypothetical protein